MLISATLLMTLILVSPFQSNVYDSDDYSDDSITWKAELPRHCSELGHKPNINFECFGKRYSVALKPIDSILNPFKPVRVFKGYDFHSAVKAYDFIPCLVSGSTVEHPKDGESQVVVYGNIFNGSFNGFAIFGRGVHHIRNADLYPDPPAPAPHLRRLKAIGNYSSSTLFAMGQAIRKTTIVDFKYNEIYKDVSEDVPPPKKFQVTSKKSPTKKSPSKKTASKPLKDLKTLYASDCSLKLVADHTFLRDVGRGDVGAALSYMTQYVQEANALFRALDLDGSGLPSQIGFRVNEMQVYQDHASPATYPLHDTRLNSDEVLEQTARMADSRVCYVLLFTSRAHLEGNLGKSHSWNSGPNGTKSGGICATDDKNGNLPNTGFVSVRLGNRKLPVNLAVIAVARILALALGATVEGANCDVGSTLYNVMSNHFPPQLSSWASLNPPGFSSCAKESISKTLSNRANCFVSAIPGAGHGKEDYEYYSVSGALSPRINRWDIGLWCWVLQPVVLLRIRF